MNNGDHVCHAIGCKKVVPPERLFCYPHWKLVPRDMQRLVWAAYRVGQCEDKSPSAAWLDAAKKAIAYVARLEGRSLPSKMT